VKFGTLECRSIDTPAQHFVNAVDHQGRRRDRMIKVECNVGGSSSTTIEKYRTLFLLLQLNCWNRTAVDSCHNWVLRLKASWDAWLRKAFGFQAPELLIRRISVIVVHFGTNDTIDGGPGHTNNWEDLGGPRPAPSP
jgi:hypothetical protein